MNEIIVVNQAIHFWKNKSPFSEVMKKVDYDPPGEMNTKHPVWTNLMSDIWRLPEQEPLYKVQRVESRFRLLIQPEQKDIASVKVIL